MRRASRARLTQSGKRFPDHPAVHYRHYKPEDFEALYAIEEICFHPPFRFGRRYMQRLAGAANATTWIAEDFEKMAGFAIAEWKPSLGDIAGYIQTIEVAPGFRRQGVARELLERIEESAREANAATLWLHVDKINDAAIALYENRGFLPVGEEANYYAPGRGALLYRKALKSATDR
jgi:[ribosomal protein S18]-alanine N-acetyltransferase